MEKIPPKLLISICTRGTIPWEFHATFGELIKPKGSSVSIEPKVFQIDAARNNQVKKFLQAAEYTHHLWLDDDLLLLRPDSVMRLLSHNLSIVSGLYFRADFPHYPLIMQEHDLNGQPMYEFPYADKEYPRDKLVTCNATGMGMMLVRRDVYSKLTPPYFKWDVERNIGEDMWFCRNVAKAGFQLKIDTGAVALHCVRAPAGPPELLWEWYQRRHPPDSRKLALIKKSLEKMTASPNIMLATGGVFR